MTERAEMGPSWPSRLVAMLERLARPDDPPRADRAALAALRRGLGKAPGEAPEMFPYVVPALDPGMPPWDEETAYLVASLFALHPGVSAADPDEPWRNNFGTSFRWLAAKTDSGSIERRFVALLNCHADDLPDHLRHAVSLLKSHDIPINWRQLTRDIRGWNNISRRTQRNWARAYWGGDITPATPELEEATV